MFDQKNKLPDHLIGLGSKARHIPVIPETNQGREPDVNTRIVGLFGGRGTRMYVYVQARFPDTAIYLDKEKTKRRKVKAGTAAVFLDDLLDMHQFRNEGFIRSKPAVPVLGEDSRFVDFIMTQAYYAKDVFRTDSFLAIHQHEPFSFKIHLHDAFGKSRGRFDLVNTQPHSEGSWYQGTGHALLMNWDKIFRNNPKYIIKLNGDAATNRDLGDMMTYFLDGDKDAVLGVRRIGDRAALAEFGTVQTIAGNRIVKFSEKLPDPPSNLVNEDIYIIKSDVLKDILLEMEASNAAEGKQNWDLSRFLEKHIGDYRFYAHEDTRKRTGNVLPFWDDVGKVSTMRSVHDKWLSAFHLYYHEKDRPLLGLTNAIPKHEISRGVPSDYLEQGRYFPGLSAEEAERLHTVLTFNLTSHSSCLYSEQVLGSVLFPGVSIDAGSSVVYSILMHNANVSGSTVANTLTDKNVVFDGENQVGIALESTRINQYFPDIGGLTLLGRQVRVPKGYTIGRSVLIFPEAKGDDFDHYLLDDRIRRTKDRTIPDGAVVMHGLKNEFRI
ncbi:hypothetical protein JXB02_05255 [Candidatus Woesearchaeota archaeon]|nr:hypothetical protein [Candidatus Woesearchaeota archaeon]